jgi:hypothetical protein
VLKRFEARTGARLLVAAVAIGGCQSDPNAVFDDLQATAGTSSGGAAGSTADGGTSSAAAGKSAGGAAGSAGGEDGGTAAQSGSPAVGGTWAVGGSEPSGGTTAVGGSGVEPMGGTMAAAGSEPMGGTMAAAGSSGGTPANGGSGSVIYGEPVTLESQNVSNTFVISCYPLMNYGLDPTLVIDKEPCQADILIKPSLSEIPQDALIKTATISLTCSNGGPGLSVLRPEADWSADTVTWSTRPAATASLGSIGTINEGVFAIDATSMVQAWLDGSRQPFGLALRADHGDGMIFASSRAPDANLRPKFSVTYAVPLK